MTRLSLNGVLFGSVLFLPWWVTLFAIAVFIALRFAPEVLFWGLALDLLYGAPLPSFFTVPLVCTLTAVVLFSAAELLKRRLTLYLPENA